MEDAVVRGGYSGSVRWEIDDAGLLTLKPDTRESTSNPGRLGQNTSITAPTWGWYQYNGEIKEIKVEPGVYTQANAVALFGADNSAGVYPNLKKVDLSGLDISKAQQLQRMFSNVKNLEEIDLSVMANKEAKNLYNINNLFNGCTNLKKVNLGGLTTRIAGVSGASNGCTMNNVFQGCNNLEEVDLSNVKLGGRTNGDDGVQYWFEGKTKLTKVTMTNSQFPGMRRFDSMFEGCTGIETIDMSNVKVSDAQYMRRMFSGCTSLETLNVSGFGELTKIVNMDGFVEGCTALENLNMDNLDNSAIGPYNWNHSITQELPSSVGAREYGRELGIDTCKALKTLSAKNSKVWMVRNNRGLPGAEYYNAAEKSETYYFTTKQMKLDPDKGSEVTIASDRDYIDLITDRDGATNKHTTNPVKNPLPDAGKNINIVGGDKNANGPGFLAPGAYTILDAERSDTGAVGMDDTYYRIAYVGSKPYKVYFPPEGIDGLKLINADSNNRTTICTRTMTWPTSGDKVIDCGSGIKITYENVAIDCNGKLHNVVVTIKKITFKDLGKIPDTSKTLGGVTYSNRIHDGNLEGGKVLQPGQSYYRPVLQATEDRGIILFNYIYDGNGVDPTAAEVGKKMLTGGSGTDIDFTIEIEEANDDTSFVFYAKDLDVASSQIWQYNSNGDACYDNLPVGNVTYGEGGEGFVLGKGVKENTVRFADHTGLYQDGKKVMTTGSDPNTSWSQFTVTADAKGSDFTWTSGIACTSYILENTKEQDLGSIEIQPKALKELTKGTLKAGDFTFTLEKDSTDPDGMPEPVNESGDPITFPQTKKNDASGGITFDKMIFKTKGENPLIDGSDAFHYFPGTSPSGNTHGEGTHNTVTYKYKVKEVPGTDLDILEYDATEHALDIKITTPENDTEMAKGIKAEIYVDGTLSKTVWSKQASNPISLSDLKFKNKKVDPVKVVIPAQKILQGRSWKDSDKFAAALTLTGEAGTPMPANTKEKEGTRYSEITIDNSGTPIKDGDDNVIGYKNSFGEITYELKDIRSTDPTAKEKKFTYDVRELEPSETTIPLIPGITYDAAPTKVEVTVKLDDETDPADPKLTAEVKYFNEDGDELTVPKFTNKYDAKQTIYKMEALKVLHKVSEEGMSKETLTGGEFDFILKPKGDNAAIAPMPKNTAGTGAGRTYTKANESDGDIQFDVESDQDDGLVFNYQKLLDAGITYDALHSDAGVDFEYEMYEVIPDGAVNNNDGTWTKTDNDGKVTIYDGVHHTRTITVKVRTNDNGTPSDTSDDFDELYIHGQKDTHKGDFFINKDGEEKPVSEIKDYDEKANHFKEYDPGEEGDLGAPIFLNYTYEQPKSSVNITKIWDDADDQDEIRPDKVTLGIESDTEGVEVDDVDIQGTEWKATVEELPVYKFDAKYIEGNEQKLEKITYTVEEKEVAGYETTYNPDPAEFTFDKADDYIVSLEISNKHTPEQGGVSGDETWGAKNETQTGKPDYKVNPKNPVTPTGLIDPDDGEAKKTVSIPKQGTYTLNEDGTITFKPETDYVGSPKRIDVVGKDLQGNEKKATYTPHVVDNVENKSVNRTVKYVYSTGEPAAEDVVQTLEFVRTGKVDPKTGEVSYDGAAWKPVAGDIFPAVDSPDIEGWTPDKAKIDAKKGEVGSGDITETVTYNPGGMSATSANSVDLINLKQTGRPVFTAATKKLPDGSENKVTVRLVDPETGKATDSKTVDALDAKGNKVGTYTIGDDGTITYTPENGYVGTPKPATVEGADRLGHTARTTYSPRIVDPTEEEAASRTVHFAYLNEQGKPVTSDVVQTVTLVRHAAEVERDENGKAVLDKDGDVIVTKWSAWEPATFPAVANPDKEAGAGWTTSDSVSALTVNEPGKVDDEYVVYVKKHYTVTYEDGEHGSSNGGSKDKEYGDTPQGNKVKADDGYKFTGRYKYVITDENGKVIDSGTTDNPKSIEVIGNIVFTPEYEKISEPEPEPDNDSKTNPKSSGGTATGDYTRIGIWVALIAAAMAAIIFVIIRRRRSE